MAENDKKKNKKKSTPEDIVGAEPKDSDFDIELGTDLNLPFATPFRPEQYGLEKRKTSHDDDLKEVLRSDGKEYGPNIHQLVAMRRMDGQARALYRLLALPARAALKSAKFVAFEDGEEEAEFIENVFRTAPSQGGMTVTFDRFMSQLLQGMFDGFAAFEKVFWIPDHGPLKGKITLRKLAYRPSDTVTFIVDKNGGYAGFRQRANIAGKTIDVYIEPEYSFYWAANEEERKFYGISFFQSAFYHYDKKVKIYYTAHLAAQRAAVGTRVGTVPLNAPVNARREFARQLSNLSMAQYMALPEGFKVESLREAGQFNYLDLINHHNSQMSKSILANFFDEEQGSGDGGGSMVSFGSPGDEMFKLMLRAIMDEIAAQINHYIIPQLIDWNFKSGKYPSFTWGKLTDEQRGAISATFDKLAVAGAGNFTPEFMRELEKSVAEDMGLDIDYEAVAQREEEEALKLVEQENMALGLNPDGSPIQAMPETEEDILADIDSQLNDLGGSQATAPTEGLPPTEPTKPPAKKPKES